MVTLDVRQSWKGVDTSAIEVVTNPGGGSCGFDFKIGHRYLVFAERRLTDDRLSVSICNLTREFDGTGDIADFLASLSLRSKGGRVFGKIELSSRSFRPGPYKPTPFAVPVRLIGNDRDLTTNATGGRFEFSALPPGAYQVEVTIPPGYSTWRTWQQAEIKDARGCAQTDFTVTPAGRITGRLVDKTGRAVSGVQVEITAHDATIHPEYGLASAVSRTDGSGYFDVENLPPGRYIAGVNLRDLPNQWNPYPRIVYPGQNEPAHLIELTLGQVVDLGQFMLPPPLSVVDVSGFVTWQDGTPAAGVYVSAWDVTGNPVERARGAGGSTAGRDGRFVIKLREGREYTFVARAGHGPLMRVSAPRIVAGQDAQPVRVIIQANPR
jgi:carboxypeptidase family protein